MGKLQYIFCDDDTWGMMSFKQKTCLSFAFVCDVDGTYWSCKNRHNGIVYKNLTIIDCFNLMNGELPNV